MRYLFKICFILFTTSLFSQNLINNPSFEVYRSCPKRLGHLNKYVSGWTTPTSGSADYFNVCSDKLSVPENYQGHQEAKFGNGYAGIYTYTKHNRFSYNYTYREYITSELKEPLIDGQKYIISFYINLADRSRYSVRNIDVLFTSKLFNSTFSSEISESYLELNKTENSFHFVEIKNTEYYSDKENWSLISQEFIATGNEQFIIIGNFNNNSKTEPLKVGHLLHRKMAYYYVDMISLTLFEDLNKNHSTRSYTKPKQKIIFN